MIKKCNIKLICTQRGKRIDKTEQQPKIIKQHSSLRECVIKTRKNVLICHQKLGCFKPNWRLNVCQVPMCFAVKVKKTDEIHVPKDQRGDYHTCVTTPGSGSKKPIYLTG